MFLIFLRVSKYTPNVIFRIANINVQCTKVIVSMNWHNNVEPPISNSVPNVVAFSRISYFSGIQRLL